jgi:hypothetical protein
MCAAPSKPIFGYIVLFALDATSIDCQNIDCDRHIVVKRFYRNQRKWVVSGTFCAEYTWCDMYFAAGRSDESTVLPDGSITEM